MAQGRIATIRADRGFGFIHGEQGSGDVFFHHSVVAGVPFDQLREGQEVSYETGPDTRDPSRVRATVVKLIEDAAAGTPFQTLEG